MESVKVKIITCGIIFLFAGLIVVICAQAAEPTVTPVFTFIYGYGPLEVGDEVTVYTAHGILCGKTLVSVAGQYGQMAVYGNDPLSNVRDGAEYGEELTVRINGQEVFFPAGSAPWFGRDGGTYQWDLN